MSENNTQIMEQIKDLCRDNGLSVDALAEKLKKQKEKEEYEQILSSVKDSKKLVGRCSKCRSIEGVSFENCLKAELGKETFFYKVVSERAERIGDVECISFSQTPQISFRAERHLLWQPSDSIVGHYCYKGIHNCSVNKHKIESLTEITKEEFETAARKHLNMLLESEWQAIADPYVIRNFEDE